MEDVIGNELAATGVRSIELPSGVTVQYAEHGDPDGIPLVMLHGATDSWRSFEPVLPHLPRSIRAFSLTQRGHGDASRPQTYRTRDFAADTAAFIEALGLGSAFVVGHSMGTTNALRLAADRPELVRGLALAGTFAAYRDSPPIVEFDAEIATLEDPVPLALARDFQLSTLAHPIDADYLQCVIAESLKVPAFVWRAVFKGLLEDDYQAGLAELRAPTLLLWGGRDAFCRRSDQDRLLAALPRARLAVYEGHGHALHWEAPVRFADDIAGFVASERD